MTPLRAKMIKAMQVRGFSVRTHESYLAAVKDLARYFHRSPDEIGIEELRVYFEYLATERSLSGASCRLFLNGIRFLYLQVLDWPGFDVDIPIPKKAQRIPELLTRAEVGRILTACANPKHRMMLTLCYGCGLRLSELVSTKVRDIDGERQLLRVEQGKGAKDRLVPLSETLLTPLRAYWRLYRPTDWLFPGRTLAEALSMTSVQKAFTQAKARAGVEKIGGIHGLRHAYATHQLEAGLPVHRLQRLLGHQDIASSARQACPSMGMAFTRPCGMSIGCRITARAAVCMISSWAMTEASLQAVMREGLDRYRGSHRLSPHQWQVCHHILDCRTEALGGIGLDCDHCHQALPHYYACRDRHCPRCQRRASQAWCERQQAAVLPATYHHLVFTLPHALNPWVQLHPEVIYALLFETVWATLSAFGADPKRLGGQLGMTAVLHTWGQTLSQHVHLHCLIPGGAFSPQGRWHPAKSTYLFPVRALSRHIRGGFVSRLRRQLKAGELPRLEDPAQIGALLDTLMATDWVVYSKPCLTHTGTVVDYLARYSHRIALTDARILSLDDDQVQLDYKDYRDGSRHKIMTLSGEELLRRFLLHVLPKGFMRIRHFGFLANRCRAERIEEIRAALNVAQQACEASTDAESPAPSDGYPCPKCRQGRLRVIAHLAPKRFDGG